MKKFQFYNHVNGDKSGVELDKLVTISLDGKYQISVPESDWIEIVTARDAVSTFKNKPSELRFANATRSMEDRIAVVRELFRDFSSHEELIIDVVHSFQGSSKKYLKRSIKKLEEWVNNLEGFIKEVDKLSIIKLGIPLSELETLTPLFRMMPTNFEAYEGFYIIAQDILAGTHPIVKVAQNDFASHLCFQIMHDKGYTSLGQKLTWNSITQPELIKGFLRAVPTASLFGSDANIAKILRTSVMVKHKDGSIEEKVHEYLREGRKINSYGSGNSMMIVMDNLHEAAAHFYYAKVLAKGNKCWVPDGIIAHADIAETIYNELVELNKRSVADWPKFRLDEMKQIWKYAVNKTGKNPNVASTTKSKDRMGLMLYKSLRLDSALFDQELEFPVAGIITVNDIDQAVNAAKNILTRRHAKSYLSLGYSGPTENVVALKTIPADTYKINDSLEVDLMEPHQGTYFILDSKQKPGGK